MSKKHPKGSIRRVVRDEWELSGLSYAQVAERLEAMGREVSHSTLRRVWEGRDGTAIALVQDVLDALGVKVERKDGKQ